MDNRFIELREEEAQIKIDNGYYESVLQQKTIINNGDSIVVNKIVIDTDSISQQSINIKEPITLQISNMLYLQKVFNNGGESTPASFNEFAPLPQSGQNFVLCNQIESAVSTDVKTMVNLLVSRINGDNRKDFGGLNIIIKYLNAEGNGDQMVVNIPKFNTEVGVENNILINLVFTNTTTPEIIVSKKDISKYNIKIELGPVTNIESITWNPYIFNDTYLLESGQYTPLELCNTINRKIQLNKNGNNPSDTNLVDSQFLRELQTLGDSLSFIQMQQDESGAWPGNNEAPMIFNHDTSVTNIWVGASQMELSYNDQSNTFYWNYIHMPIYDSKGAEIIMYNGDNSNPDDYKMWINNKLGGSLFHGLTATDEDGNYYNFWENDLGFNLNTLLTLYKTIAIVGATPADKGSVPVIKGIDSVNTTGGYINIGSAIATASPDYNIVPVPNVSGAPVVLPQEATSENTTPINAPISIINKLYQYPYFCIELQCGYNNDVISVDGNHSNIVAMVSKYYTLNSFTYGSMTDSITYTHRGIDSLYIDSFRIRILNPDKILAQGIGDNSTVILQIVKGQN